MIMRRPVLKGLITYGTFATLFAGLLINTSAAAAPTSAPAQVRVTSSFDTDWRFLKGDTAGAETPDFDDASWRKLDVPHDWSIEGPFDKNNPASGAGGFLPAGVGWYRKHFKLSADEKERRRFIRFGAAVANSAVWI